MDKIVFTIVAKNYIGLADVLLRSINETNAGFIFYVFIADEIDAVISSGVDNATYLEAKTTLDISGDKWKELTFKYDLTEFCTSIKPACFNYLIAKHGESKIIYFDPDIAVFNSLDPILEELDTDFLILTPHITTLEKEYSGEALETDFLGSGIYNLGFLAIRSCAEGADAMQWWHKRLMDRCFIDKADAIFTDQKWMNYLTCFFDKGVRVSRDLGRNIAPWNYFERKVAVENNVFYVESRLQNGRKNKLLFAHFSGLDYKDLSIKKNKNVPALRYNEYGDLQTMYDFYKQRLVEGKIETYFHLKYSYNVFSDGMPILSFHRRLYRRLIEMEAVENPFDSNNEFYKNLKGNNLILADEGTSLDKTNPQHIEGFDSKIAAINRIIIIFRMIIGLKKYVLLSKLFLRYFRPENQLFLYNRKFMKSSFRK